MKYIIKRIAALASAAVISVSTLTACGESATLMDFIGSEDSKINLDGQEFNIADRVSAEGVQFLDYKENSVLYDAVIQRFADVEKELNCTINMNIVGYAIEDLISMLLADSFKNEMLYGSHADIQDIAQSNLAIPVTDHLHIVDIKNYDKYGTPSIQECNSYMGEIIAISPLSWLYKQPTALELLIFNMDLVNKNGKTDPREFIENRNWNWEALEHVISDYYVKQDDAVTYSLVCRGLDLIKLLCLGNGVSFTYKDEEGNIKSDFGQPNMLEAIDFYNKLLNEYEDRFTAEDSWDYLIESFATSQNSMVCLTAAWQLYNTISYEVENYTVMPFPTGPKGEYGIWPSTVEGMQGFVVLNSCDDAEIAFRIIDMICEPMDGYETEESRLEYLSENVFYNITDAEVAKNTHKNGTYSYWKAEVGNFQPDTLWRELSMNNRSVTEVIESYTALFNQAIEEYMTPNLEIQKYFE